MVIAAIAGIAVAISPVPAVIATIIIVGVVWLLGRGAGVTRVFLAALAIIVIGYAFFNRAFAYVGASPVFVGEVVLGLGILALIYSIRRWRLTPVTFLILVFMVWGALQTIPYLPQYGVDALRDAVAWIYAAFALILVTVAPTRADDDGRAPRPAGDPVPPGLAPRSRSSWRSSSSRSCRPSPARRSRS